MAVAAVASPVGLAGNSRRGFAEPQGAVSTNRPKRAQPVPLGKSVNQAPVEIFQPSAPCFAKALAAILRLHLELRKERGDEQWRRWSAAVPGADRRRNFPKHSCNLLVFLFIGVSLERRLADNLQVRVAFSPCPTEAQKRSLERGRRIECRVPG